MGELVIQSESGTFYTTFPTSILFNEKLDEMDKQILNFLNNRGKSSSKIISSELKIPQVTVWRRIKRLQELGLIQYKKREYFLTELGRIRT